MCYYLSTKNANEHMHEKSAIICWSRQRRHENIIRTVGLTTVFSILIILTIEVIITKFFSINTNDTGAGCAGTFTLIGQTFRFSAFELTERFILIGIVATIKIIIADPFAWYASTPVSNKSIVNTYMIIRHTKRKPNAVLTFSSIRIVDYCTVAALCNFPRRSHRHNLFYYHSARPMVGKFRLCIGMLSIHTLL